MDAFTVSLLLIAVVVASSALTRMSPIVVPLPFVQIALGALMASIFDFRVELDPETFLLFLAPLLFLDGWRIPKEGLLRDKGNIAALAFGLVFFTVVGAGCFIHWMIPAMPLAVAFALAAALSPTDAVAVSAIINRAPLNRRLMQILAGESLLNDASGLVCMRFAVAAVATGAFSISDAFATFLWVAVGGVVMGVSITWLATSGKDWVARRFGEETGSQILISLLIPFAAYILAERAEVSGILAAVAAGIVMSYEERSGQALAITRLRRAAVWDALQFLGNGVIFILLGEQLPTIVSNATEVLRETGEHRQWWLLAYVVAIYGVLIAMRAIWVWCTFRLLRFCMDGAEQQFQMRGWRLVAVTSLCGVRGAVTLAGVLAFPFVLADGSPFPTRDLAIFLAAGVIVLSLVTAKLGLPYVLMGTNTSPEPLRRAMEDKVRIATAQAAIAAVKRRLEEGGRDERALALEMEAGTQIIALYRQRIDVLMKTGSDIALAQSVGEAERVLRLVAIRAERAELYRIVRSDHLPDELVRRLIRETDLLESRFSL
ncbi:Na+/H+ antiporter [Rhizobiaceae bacterium n13]|uniref:Na+/H+ antiporter n=1 Tax=Ferirhizobium litorale TaxID=2927786 RepID=A0AAE3QIB3_9HYPH|nr:Na+/H+ antiporter [Fererhizobium litorale]MDI7862738.1 Na+/H+ antiporter [Fererhizobium litorale]MDI7924398.1 Na+/H+ antiporter [Fererhizobium litorale]